MRGPDYSPKGLPERLRQTGEAARLALHLVWGAAPPLTLGLLALVALQGLLPLAQLALFRLVIDRLSFDLGVSTAVAPTALRLPLEAWIGMAALVVAATQLADPFVMTLRSIAADRLTGHMAQRLLAAGNSWVGLERFEDPTFADDLERARTVARRGILDLALYGARAAAGLVSLVGAVAILAGLHPAAPALLLLASLPQVARQYEFVNRMGSHLYSQTPEARRLEYLRDQLLLPGPAKDVRLFRAGPFFEGRYTRIFGTTVEELDRVRATLTPRVALAAALGAAGAGAVFVAVAWQVARGRSGLGDLALYGGAATAIGASLRGLGFDLGFLPWVLGFLPSVERVLAAPPDLPVPAAPRPVPQPLREGVVFEEVSFAYPGSERLVLAGLSFRITPGECLALVGRNGAGKTTVVKLLLRLYDPVEGRILLDGVDLRDLDPEALRREVAVVFQDFVRFEFTAGENVGLGWLPAFDDEGRVREAAARAGADSVIDGLPEGLGTRLGRRFGGRELSEGEWQKLSLARAFMRDALLMVLDEPTAALDVVAEHHLYSRFRDLARGLATLLVSHRFSTVRMADRILHLEAGRIAEEGTHAELVAAGGGYAHLYRLQAARYLEEPDGG